MTSPPKRIPHIYLLLNSGYTYNMAEDKIELTVTGMSCASCVARVEKALLQLKGVKDANVNLASHRATVVFDQNQIGEHDIIARIREAG